MADAGSNAVYTGFWLDRDREGLVRGATLTLTNQQAAALLAFLAIVVTFAANRSFKIFRFCLHHLIHPDEGEAGSETLAKRRQQVILRNSETAGGALMSLLDATISKRSGSRASVRAISKSVLLKFLITAHWLIFIALSILTSKTFVGKTVVSRRTSTCGKWVMSDTHPLDDSAESVDIWMGSMNELLYNGTLDANNYVHNCYGGESSRGFFNCAKFVSRSLPFSEEHNVSCPFEKGLCLTGENSAFAMDSGNISFSDLGINKKHAKDLSVRRRTTCAVVDQQPFFVGTQTTKKDPTGILGNQTSIIFSFGIHPSGANNTISYRNESYSSTYELQEFTYINNTASKALQPTKGTNDVSLMLLRAPAVFYLDAQDDPWFIAHDKLVFDNSTGDVKPGFTRYRQDYFLNVLACDERSQLCNQITGQCSQWHGLILAFDDLVSPLGEPLLKEGMDGFDDMVWSVLLVMGSLMTSYLTDSIQGRGQAALQAAKYLSMGTQYHLDPEQWKVELRYWFQMALARVQLEIFNTIERPVDVDPERNSNSWAGNDDVLKALCGCIKFRSAGHTSLSTTGIVVILLCTMILTLISFLDQLMASRFLRGRFRHFLSAWDQTENLALLKTIDEVGTEGKSPLPSLLPLNIFLVSRRSHEHEVINNILTKPTALGQPYYERRKR